MIVRFVFILVFALSFFMNSFVVKSQQIAIRTNVLAWSSLTPNIGLEVALNNNSTIDLWCGYNPWVFKDDKMMRFWLIQPEIKYWICEKFEGLSIGAHLLSAQYYGGFKDIRYDGYLVGAGFSCNYDMILSPRWNLDFGIGLGYARLWYDKSPRIPCVTCKEHKFLNYFGPTKASISIVYLLK